MHTAGSDCVKYALNALFLKKNNNNWAPPTRGFTAAEAVITPIMEIVGGAWKESDEDCFLFQNSFLFLSVIRIGTV